MCVCVRAPSLHRAAVAFQEGTGRRIADGFQAAAQFLAGLVIAFIKSWQLSLVLLAGIPVIGGATALLTKASKQGQTVPLSFALLLLTPRPSLAACPGCAGAGGRQEQECRAVRGGGGRGGRVAVRHPHRGLALCWYGRDWLARTDSQAGSSACVVVI